MKKRILIAGVAALLINAVPANASLYIEWLDSPAKISPVSFMVYKTYNSPDSPKGWLDNNGFDDSFVPDEGPHTFILKSDAGESGQIQVKIKSTLSTNAHIIEENAANTKFIYGSAFRGFNITSLDGLYDKYFDLPNIYLDETLYGFISSSNDGIYTRSLLTYSQTDSFLDYFEIGRPYNVRQELAVYGIWIGAEPVDPDASGTAGVIFETEQNIKLTTTPEPATMLLFSAGLLGAFAKKRKRS